MNERKTHIYATRTQKSGSGVKTALKLLTGVDCIFATCLFLFAYLRVTRAKLLYRKNARNGPAALWKSGSGKRIWCHYMLLQLKVKNFRFCESRCKKNEAGRTGIFLQCWAAHAEHFLRVHLVLGKGKRTLLALAGLWGDFASEKLNLAKKILKNENILKNS